MKLNYFNFKKFASKILLTNDFGDYLFVSNSEFKNILLKNVDLNSEFGKKLIEKNFVYDKTNLEYSLDNKYNMRRIKGHLNEATSLHIFVVTTACNMGCIYCQANSGSLKNQLYMTKEIAEKAVDVALQSPSHFLNFEFQGGEPLMNFEIIKHIVLYAEMNKGKHEISYNIVTNLTLLTDEIIDFFKEYNLGVSTSLDGNEFIHNNNRPFKNGDETFSKVIDSIKRLRKEDINVGAIQTTTKTALKYPKEIVNAYKEIGFETIFIRPLTPLGKATVNWSEIGYTPEEFIRFYKQALKEIIDINKNGYYLREEHSSILLTRINGEFINYMELRSPCGASIGQMAYYPDGNVFTCDEGRMLYEMGDNTFCLGNVFDNMYSELINNGVCKTVCASSILETIPTCCDCVYQPYCGTCPVVNYANGKDVIEKEPHGYRCKIYSGMLDSLFEYVSSGDMYIINILESWSK